MSEMPTRPRALAWIRCGVDGYYANGSRLLVERLRSSEATAAAPPRSHASVFPDVRGSVPWGPPPAFGTPAYLAALTLHH